ncbi:MAG TPA: type II secretion system F family protein [Longimicrobium sp.]|jgi:type II secretory pathway component PulF
MTAFRYRASTPEGKIVEGVLQAPSRDGVLADLRARALFPVAVEEAGDAEVSGGRGGRAGASLRLQLTRSLSTLLESGFPVDRALSVAADLTDDAMLRGVVQAVRQDVRAGRPLSDAFAAHPRIFPPVYVAMVAAGEAGGTLGPTFGRLATLQEEEAELRSSLVSALLYPALMMFAGGMAVTLLVFVVLPQFAGVLQDAGAKLPFTTRVLLATTTAASRWGWLVALVAAASIWAGVYTVRTPAGRAKWDALLLRIPGVGDLIRRVATARIARILGMLLQNGVPLVNSLEIARGTAGNVVLARGLGDAVRAVREGKTLAASAGPMLPKLARQMMSVGEETGTLPEMLLRVATVYDREVRDTLKRAITLVEPTLILLFGAVVGFIALGMLQAIYSINAGAL